MHIHQLVEVKAGPLHHLHLPDVHVVEGVDAWENDFKNSAYVSNESKKRKIDDQPDVQIKWIRFSPEKVKLSSSS